MTRSRSRTTYRPKSPTNLHSTPTRPYNAIFSSPAGSPQMGRTDAERATVLPNTVEPSHGNDTSTSAATNGAKRHKRERSQALTVHDSSESPSRDSPQRNRTRSNGTTTSGPAPSPPERRRAKSSLPPPLKLDDALDSFEGRTTKVSSLAKDDSTLSKTTAPKWATKVHAEPELSQDGIPVHPSFRRSPSKASQKQLAFGSRNNSWNSSLGGMDSPASIHSSRSEASIFSVVSTTPFDNQIALSVDAHSETKKQSFTSKTLLLRLISFVPVPIKASFIWVMPCIILFSVFVFILGSFAIMHLASLFIVQFQANARASEWNDSVFLLLEERMNVLTFWNPELAPYVQHRRAPMTGGTEGLESRDLSIFDALYHHPDHPMLPQHKIRSIAANSEVSWQFPLNADQLKSQLTTWWSSPEEISTDEHSHATNCLDRLVTSHRDSIQHGTFSYKNDSLSIRHALLEPYDNLRDIVQWLSEDLSHKWSPMRLAPGSAEFMAWFTLLQVIQAENDISVYGSFALTNGSFLSQEEAFKYLHASDARRLWLGVLSGALQSSTLKDSLSQLILSSTDEQQRKEWDLVLYQYTNMSTLPSSGTTISVQDARFGSTESPPITLRVPTVSEWFENSKHMNLHWRTLANDLLNTSSTSRILESTVPLIIFTTVCVCLCTICVCCLTVQTAMCSANVLQPYVKAQQKEENVFFRFVPRELMRLVNCHDVLDMKLGLFTTSAFCVGFCDIRNFTTLSEALTAHQVFEFLNSYLSKIGPVIRRNSGYVAQYLGDGIVSLFAEQHRGAAIRSALELQHEVLDFNFLNRGHSFYPQIQAGFGLVLGHNMVIGTMGDPERIAQTILGKAVQQADLLEGMTKLVGAKILVTEDMITDLHEHQNFFKVRCVANVAAGETVIRVFEILDPLIDKEKIVTLPLFNQAMEKLFSNDFGRARELFVRVQNSSPRDKACVYRIQQCDKFIKEGVSSWDGVERE